MTAAIAAGDRFFRQYHQFCAQSDEDSLFHLLNAVHSMNDRFHKHLSLDFFDVPEFLALKALRNLFHHEVELIHQVKIIPAGRLPQLTTDLVLLCLVEAGLVEKAIDGIDKRYRDEQAPKIRDVLKWYGSIVNLSPAIFNMASKVCEMVLARGIALGSDAFKEMLSSWEYEEEHGHSHFVSGDIQCQAGSVDEVLAAVFT